MSSRPVTEQAERCRVDNPEIVRVRHLAPARPVRVDIAVSIGEVRMEVRIADGIGAVVVCAPPAEARR